MNTYTGKVISDVECFQMVSRTANRSCFEPATFKRFTAECADGKHIVYVMHTAKVEKDKTYTFTGDKCIIDGNDAVEAFTIKNAD